MFAASPEREIAFPAVPPTGTSVPAQASKPREMERYCGFRGGHRGPGRLRQ
jgi:hypothetical protein